MIIKVQQGSLEGCERTSVLTNVKYNAFLGIPYAEPPLKDLRFRPPIPIIKWDDVLDATKEKNISLQMDSTGNTIIGDEDCLYLNVYTPLYTSQGKNLAVMVYIHGGGLFSGSGSVDEVGPDYLINYDIVLVTINYRLNIFGFLNVGTLDCPGNCGLKDQALAMKWVKNNIDKFGGDPENITIFGESAGGISVHLHMMSPYSKGLFHRAIAQSGTAIVPVPEREDPSAVGFAVGKLLGYHENDPKELVHELRKRPAEDVLKAAEAVRADLFAKGVRHKIPFIQSVETIKENAFLPERPSILMESIAPLPLMAGIDDKEGIVDFPENNRDELEALNDIRNFEVMIQNNTGCPDAILSEVSQKVRKFYFGDKAIGWDTRDIYIDLLTDFLNVPWYESFCYKEPVYLYEFTFDGALNKSVWMREPGAKKDLFDGAGHTDDIAFLFYLKSMHPDLTTFEEPDLTIIKRMCTMWTNFAKTGNPTPDLSAVGVEWIPSTGTAPKYLKIDEDLKLCEGEIWAERRAFWREMHKFIDQHK